MSFIESDYKRYDTNSVQKINYLNNCKNDSKCEELQSFVNDGNEIESQLPQMKEIVNLARSPSNMNHSDTKREDFRKLRAVSYQNDGSLEPNLYLNLNKFSKAEVHSRNKENVGGYTSLKFNVTHRPKDALNHTSPLEIFNSHQNVGATTTNNRAHDRSRSRKKWFD